MFRNCLICTDFNDSLQRLVNFVPSLAKTGLEKIVFFHNVSLWSEGEIPRIDQDKVDQSIAKLQPAKKTIPEGVEVEIEVTSGLVVDNIKKIIDKHQIEVIILGSAQKNLLETRLFGSITISLTKVTSLPLMILRPQLISTYTEEELSLRCQHLWRYFLIPFNDENNDYYLIENIKKYLQQKEAKCLEKCLLLSVIDDGSIRVIPLEYKIKERQQKLAKIEQELSQFGLNVSSEILKGNPLHEVLNSALIYDISCVAIAYNSHNLLETVVPSLAKEILQHSWFPILFFSPKK